MSHITKIQQTLEKKNILAPGEPAEQYFREAELKHTDVEEIIAQRKKISADVVYVAVAESFGVKYIKLDTVELPANILSILPESIAQTHKVVVFAVDPQRQIISIATRDPDDIQTTDFIQKKTGMQLNIFYTDTASINSITKQYHKTLEEEFQTLTDASSSTDTFKGLTDLHRVARDVPVVKVVDVLLDYAVYENASDIHIEPTERDLLVRYRIDGILVDAMTLPKSLQQAMVARIKVLANLKIDEHRLPQDGRFNIEKEGKKIAFRVSILPVYDGEKAVLRLLDESAKVLTFEQLGMQKERADIVRRNILKPHGIVLVTGPTGSGKTTTLYSILNVLNTSKVNISTVEDPIEYRIPRVNQAQVNPRIGFTFAVGLRALLRQDPNIIMVGEIRDAETAEISAHAAMTGHLVLSTLHTNDAVGAIPRLTEMGVARYLVASTTNLIVAQRLVRKICDSCKVTVDVTKDLVAGIEKQFKFQDIVDTLIRFGEVTEGAEATDLHFFKGNGCEQCGGRGYKGRIGLYEILEITDSVVNDILSQATTESLLATALSQGMMTIAQDGFLKAKQGITTIDEILRVAKE